MKENNSEQRVPLWIRVRISSEYLALGSDRRFVRKAAVRACLESVSLAQSGFARNSLRIESANPQSRRGEWRR